MRKFFFFDHLKLAKLSCTLEAYFEDLPFVVSLDDAKIEAQKKKKPMPVNRILLYV